MAGLEVTLLGGFGLAFDGERLAPIPSRIGREVFAFLVLYRDQAHSRERLAERFWPDVPESRARRRLSHTLWQVQDALGELPTDHRYIESVGDTLRFNRDAPHHVDVEEFERRLERYRPGSGHAGRRDLHRLESALDLYAGDLLDGFDHDWATVERERLTALHLDALGWMVELARTQGAYDQALVHARRLTMHDPLREDAHREVMRLYTLLGRTSEALRQYERCRSVLAEELGAEPARATQQLAEFIDRQRGAAPGVGEVPADPHARDVRLVGRERHRAVLVEALERTLAGAGAVSFLEGEAGLGKSRLVAQLVADARWRGFTVAHGSCDPGGGLAYLAVAEAVSELMTPVRIAQLRPRVGESWMAEVGRVVPRLAHVDQPASAAPPEQAAGRIREGFVRVILGVAELEPTLLVVEDVHESDAETLQVLEWLAGRVHDHRLHVVVTYRSAEARARDDVWAVLRAIDLAATPDRVLLEPLTAFGTADLVRDLVGGDVDPARLARVHEETGGNPLFVRETIRLLREQGRLGGTDDDVALPIPGSLRELTVSRVRAVSPSARELLATVAVQTGVVELEVLQHAMAVSDQPGAVADAAAELLRRGLLTETPDGYTVPHDQVRQGVVDQLDGAELAGIHGRVADALCAHHPDRVEEIARHHDAAGNVEPAVRAWRDAGERALSVHAYATARRHLARAVELQRQRPASVQARIDLLFRHDEVLAVLGRYGEQETVLEELVDLVGTDASEVMRRRAWWAVHTDRYELAEQWARQAVETAGDEAARAGALTVLGTVATWRGAHDAAVEALEEAVAAHQQPAEAAEAQVALGTALRGLERFDEAADVLQLAARAYDELDDVHGAIRALGELATIRNNGGDPALAVEAYEDVLERCRRIGDARREGVTLVNLGLALYRTNRLAAALERYEAATRVFTAIGSARGRATVEANAAVLRHEMLADDQRAEDDVRSALAWFTRIGEDRTMASCHRVLALIALRQGEPARAREHLDVAWPRARDNRLMRVRLRQSRAAVARAEGDLAGARHQLTAALGDATTADVAFLRVLLLADRARVRLAAGDIAGADEDSRAAVGDLAGTVSRAHLAWFARHEVARALGAPDAEQALRQAAAELDRALEGLPGHLAARARREVPEHAAILATIAEARPQLVTVRLAGADVPTGRPLDEADLRVVELEVPRGAYEDTAARRRAIPELVAQAARHRAAPTVDDLAEVLQVSPSTIRRDLSRLRQDGTEVATRGTRPSPADRTGERKVDGA